MTFLREARLNNERLSIEGFRVRGGEVTRLESFSDAVFGFALTLLVVSLDVPKTFDDLFNTMRGFPAFAVCFLLLAMIWNSHYKFCRRYGLDDIATRVITLVMLFLVLFYVYPLKFLFNLSLGNMLNEPVSPLRVTFSQLSALLTIYALGFIAVYGAFALLYLHAWHLRDQLELNAVERFDTIHIIYRFLMVIGIGLLAAGLAQFPKTVDWSGFSYLLLFPVLRIHRILHRRWRRRFRTPVAAD
jgi:uncharacterized membrane protein